MFAEIYAQKLVRQTSRPENLPNIRPIDGYQFTAGFISNFKTNNCGCVQSYLKEESNAHSSKVDRNRVNNGERSTAKERATIEKMGKEKYR
uniref:Uncharacterized protein n=1 Tax=Romanomermis culicivorax TaxID=13658 RepID=A0A915JME2_ROMCU